ncbi:MAG: ATP-binding protein [Chloroflexales bacterium]
MTDHAGRVLVVDADPNMCDLCAQTLRRVGFDVELADAAPVAMAHLRAHAFDLVLLESSAPERGDDSLLAQIRAHDANLPVLLVSGAATVAQVADALRLGIHGLLQKPFQPDELCVVAVEIVEKRRAARARERVAALRPLLQVSQRLHAELDLSRLQNLIIETVRSELEADRASLMLFDDLGQSLQITACSGLPPNVVVGHRVPVTRGLAGWVATHRIPLSINASGEVMPPNADVRGVFSNDKMTSSLAVPVLAGDHLLGVLNAAKVHSGVSFSAADQDLLLLLAGQAATAITNARLYSQVAHSEERYRALLQHANDAVLLLDVGGRTILEANLALEQLSGYHRRELLGMCPVDLLPNVDSLAKTALNGATNGHGHGDSQEIETVLQTRWAQPVQVAVSVSVVPYAGQRLLLVIARDISERQRIARQMLQTEKLAALGRLSASMAHEINNPLQAIHNSVHLMLNRPLPEEKRQRYLEMTREEIDRLISIVQRILDFYRPTRDGMRPVDLGDILDSVLTLTSTQMLDHNIQVIRADRAALPRVLAVTSHIKQVCLSLIFNAIEAMPDGGELRLGIYLAADGSDVGADGFTVVAGGHTASPMIGPTVVIEIGDTGAGISSQDLPKIFEPFYTTRMKGTGLSLALSYSIVEQHHGEMAVRSALGQGTTFRIRLPVAL